jgi:hypothetical protein
MAPSAVGEQDVLYLFLLPERGGLRRWIVGVRHHGRRLRRLALEQIGIVALARIRWQHDVDRGRRRRCRSVVVVAAAGESEPCGAANADGVDVAVPSF